MPNETGVSAKYDVSFVTRPELAERLNSDLERIQNMFQSNDSCARRRGWKESMFALAKQTGENHDHHD